MLVLVYTRTTLMMQTVLLLLLLAGAPAPVASSSSGSGAQCLDNNGKSVSWWFTYKLPNGYTFAYLDANSRRSSGVLELSPYQLNDEQNPSALIRTLRALVSQNSSGTVSVESPFILYNDQPDNANPSSSYGHTKGVVAAGDDGGFWLLHSTPNFPSSDDSPNFFFPEREITYGQTFLCISVGVDDIDAIAGQLLYTHPFVYLNEGMGTKEFLASHPIMAKVFNGDWIHTAGTNKLALNVGGRTFTSLVKNAEWNDDLYEGLVAPAFGSDMLVESWLRGKKEGTYCKPSHEYEVVDVRTLTVRQAGGQGNISWSESQDHAKWGLALDDSSVVCVCDINRMTTQRVRGGGCLCFESEPLSQQLYHTVQTSYLCNGTHTRATQGVGHLVR